MLSLAAEVGLLVSGQFGQIPYHRIFVLQVAREQLRVQCESEKQVGERRRGEAEARGKGQGRGARARGAEAGGVEAGGVGRVR